MSAHIDLIKETAYQIWIETHQPFTPEDIYQRIWQPRGDRQHPLPTARQIANMLMEADYVKIKRRSGLNQSRYLYVWTGDVL
ncbi:hypothetical protein [Candidatus Methanomassiliicoccus intestinalis]|jgi:hypothetical protein|uniref:TFIIE alpha subunit n=1 Tax=Siphoviridae sp. ctedO8 TaxID=2827907 RepID=A0A8S5T4I0_9CAUD|nr:MAG TPA: TFIIE alpha subunit [Siphoviridae sp. ctedO8]